MLHQQKRHRQRTVTDLEHNTATLCSSYEGCGAIESIALTQQSELVPTTELLLPLPTLELYTIQVTYFSSYALIMTGTEHKNQILGAYGARHCIIPESKKKGKKAVAQTDKEGKIQLEEPALELDVIAGNDDASL